MTSRALNFLASIAILCVVGLVALGFAPGDQAQAETTLSTVLFGSVTAVAALVAPQRPNGS